MDPDGVEMAALADAAASSAALRVLTERSLLRLVYSFVPSMEQELSAYDRWVRVHLNDPREFNGLVRPFEWAGLLAQAAMFFGDRAKLDVLMHMNKCARHGKLPGTWTLWKAVHGGVRGNQFSLLDYFVSQIQDCRVDPKLLSETVLRRDLAQMDWVCAHVPPALRAVDVRIVDACVKDGHLPVIRWLHDHGVVSGFTARTLDLAAGSGNLELVRFLCENRPERCSTEAMDRAATFGHLAVVAYLHVHRREGCTVHAMDGAAKNGHLELVQFLHACRREGCSAAALNYAATNGHLNVVRFLVEHRSEGCLFEARNCALLRGFPDIAAYLLDQMRPDVTLCSVRMHTGAWLGLGRRQCQVSAQASSSHATSRDDNDGNDDGDGDGGGDGSGGGDGDGKSPNWLKIWRSLLSRRGTA